MLLLIIGYRLARFLVIRGMEGGLLGCLLLSFLTIRGNLSFICYDQMIALWMLLDRYWYLSLEVFTFFTIFKW
jgi:hypothetical protein